MNRSHTLLLAAVAAFALGQAFDVDAARVGGGRNLGTQRQSIAPPAATPAPSAAAANPVMPAQPGMAAAKGAAPAAAAGGASRWLGPIAGLAAGLGLAALLSHFGLSEGFASLLLIGLLVFAGIVVLKLVLGRRKAPAASPLQYAGSGAGAMPGRTEMQTPASRGAFEPAFGGATAPASKFPPGFDAAGFARQAKLQFTQLQAAYDRSDRQALADVMTPEMFAELARDLDTRGTHEATVVEALDAEVLEASTEGDRHWVSVRFTGRTREDGGATHTVDETWNLSKPVDGTSGWLLAGIQQTVTA